MNNAIPFRAVMDVLDRLESEAAGGAPVCVAIVNRTGKLAAFLSLDGTPSAPEPSPRARHTPPCAWN